MTMMFDKKDVFSWSNAEEAKQYIGKQGYFGDSLCELQERIEDGEPCTLSNVMESNDCNAVFDPLETYNIDMFYGLFLPADKVKKPEKKWRAFKDIREFADTLGIDNKFLVGTSIKWRYKSRPSNQGVSLITTTFISPENEIFITLGSQTYILDRLFTDLEWLDKDGNWQPFGVEE